MTLPIICVVLPILLLIYEKYDKLKKNQSKITITFKIFIIFIVIILIFNIINIISSDIEKKKYEKSINDLKNQNSLLENGIKGLKEQNSLLSEQINLLGNRLAIDKKILLYSSSDEKNTFEGTFDVIITFTKKISSHKVNVALDSLFTYADIKIKLDNGVENFYGTISSSVFQRIEDKRKERKEEVISFRGTRPILIKGSPVPPLKKGRPVPSFSGKTFIIEKRVKINELCYLFSIKTDGLQLFSQNGYPYKQKSSNKDPFIVDNLPFNKNKALRYNVESVVFKNQFIK